MNEFITKCFIVKIKGYLIKTCLKNKRY